jgi:opacity protein-like surface antigen
MNKFFYVMVCMMVVMGGVVPMVALAGSGQPVSTVDQRLLIDTASDIDKLKAQQAHNMEQLDGLRGDVTNLQNVPIESTPFYIGMGGSWVLKSDSDNDIAENAEYDDGYGYNVSVGKLIGSTRFELDASYQKSDMATAFDTDVAIGDVELSAIMANAYYTYYVTDKIGLYGMVGAGAGKFEITGGNTDDSNSTFVSNVGVGATYCITDNIAIDAGWKYTMSSDVDVDSVTTLSYGVNMVNGNVRYMF